MLASTAYPHLGGRSSHIEALSKGLRTLGNNVEILSANKDLQKPLPRLAYYGVPPILKRLGLKPYQYVWAEYIFTGVLAKRLRVSIHRADVVNAQDVVVCKSLAKEKIEKACVLTLHGYYTDELVSDGCFRRGSVIEKHMLETERIGYDYADTIVTVDSRLASYVRERWQKNNVHVIHNFVDIEKFSFQLPRTKPQTFTLFCPRRLVAKTGVCYAVDAMNILINKYNLDIRLVIAGRGPKELEIRKLVSEYNLASHVHLVGRIEHDKILSYYHDADIVIIPSIHIENVEEATSISALEAMATGTPVIASNVGGLRELIDDERDGLLVREKDPEAIADAVRKLFYDLELRKKLAENARKKIEAKYSHIAAAKVFCSVYKQLID